MKELLTALAAAIKECGYAQKKGTNDFHHYNYVYERDVMEKTRPAFEANDLLLVPSVKTMTFDERNNTHVVMEYRLFHIPSDQVLFFDMAGSGGDKGDKGVYKAITGANKYALMKLCQMSTGDDPEKEETPESSTDSAKTTKQRKPSADHEVRLEAFIKLVKAMTTAEEVRNLYKANDQSMVVLKSEAPALHEQAIEACKARIAELEVH